MKQKNLNLDKLCSWGSQEIIECSEQLIFLDIDGVLNSDSTKERIRFPDSNIEFVGVDHGIMCIMNKLCEEFPNSGWILSSTWRENWGFTKNYLNACNFKGSTRWAGRTTQSRYKNNNEIFSNARGFSKPFRIHEILDWLDEWVKDRKIPWICIDDDYTLNKHYELHNENDHHIIQTDSNKGFSESNLEESILKLKKQKEINYE